MLQISWRGKKENRSLIYSFLSRSSLQFLSLAWMCLLTAQFNYHMDDLSTDGWELVLLRLVEDAGLTRAVGPLHPCILTEWDLSHYAHCFPLAHLNSTMKANAWNKSNPV